MKKNKIILAPIIKNSKIVIDANASNKKNIDFFLPKENKGNKKKTKYKLKPIKKNQNKIIKTKKSKIVIDAGDYNLEKLEQDLRELKKLYVSSGLNSKDKKDELSLEDREKIIKKIENDDFSDFVFTDEIKNDGKNIINSNNFTRNLVKN